MFSDSFSVSNLAEWTPITTSSLAYFFSSLARSGSVWMQLMQQYVQKSSRTILPRRSFSRRGPAVFSQPTPPSSSGALARRPPAGGSSATLAGAGEASEASHATAARTGKAASSTGQRPKRLRWGAGGGVCDIRHSWGKGAAVGARRLLDAARVL